MIGTPEMVVILVLAVLLFGPQKLPELARAIGKAVGEYNKAVRDFEQEADKVKSEVMKEAQSINKDVVVEESRRNSAEIRKIARTLGIPTENRDDAALLKDIDERMAKNKAASAPPAKAAGEQPKAGAQSG